MASCLNAIDDWQIDIDDDDVWLLLSGEVDGFAPIARLRADVEIAAGVKKSTQTASNNNAIVGQEDADHHCSNRCDAPHPLDWML